MIYKKQIELDEVKGTIEVELPKHAERMEILKNMNIQFGKDGEVNFGTNQIEVLGKMSEIANERVKKVALTTVDGEKITSLEELEYYTVYSELLNELIPVVINGAKLGKQK